MEGKYFSAELCSFSRHKEKWRSPTAISELRENIVVMKCYTGAAGKKCFAGFRERGRVGGNVHGCVHNLREAEEQKVGRAGVDE